MAKSPRPFSLPEEGKRALSQMLRKGTHAARDLRRARILLRLDEGLHPDRIAEEVGVHANTVFNTRKKAEEHGWPDAVQEPTRSGRPPEFSGEARARITALACSAPPKGRSRWTLNLLADKAVELGFVDEISHESVRQVLKKTSSSRT